MNLSDATVAQVLIPVEDFERGTAFYRDTLGIPILFAAPPQMAFFMCGQCVCWWVWHRRARRHSVARRSTFASRISEKELTLLTTEAVPNRAVGGGYANGSPIPPVPDI
jgi:catechol 2,3-dioxygenase-like lactoylglutathione lyase family enzyme